MVAAALIALVTTNADAQRRGAEKPGGSVRLSSVISAFLADSGVRTRGLPWTTGEQLAIKWESPGPIPNPDQSALRQGIALARIGTFTGTVGDSVALSMTITLTGT